MVHQGRFFGTKDTPGEFRFEADILRTNTAVQLHICLFVKRSVAYRRIQTQGANPPLGGRIRSGRIQVVAA